MAWRRGLPAGLQGMTPRLIHGVARFTRPLTLGVRAVILDEAGAPRGGARVFLVRHSYVPGWHLPGGAVEPGESAAEALVREIREECAIAIDGDAPLFGLYHNRQVSRRDHVAVYLVHSFRMLERRQPDWEIVEAGFFDAARPPDGTTTATRTRLGEALEGRPATTDW